MRIDLKSLFIIKAPDALFGFSPTFVHHTYWPHNSVDTTTAATSCTSYSICRKRSRNHCRRMQKKDRQTCRRPRCQPSLWARAISTLTKGVPITGEILSEAVVPVAIIAGLFYGTYKGYEAITDWGRNPDWEALESVPLSAGVKEAPGVPDAGVGDPPVENIQPIGDPIGDEEILTDPRKSSSDPIGDPGQTPAPLADETNPVILNFSTTPPVPTQPPSDNTPLDELDERAQQLLDRFSSHLTFQHRLSILIEGGLVVEDLVEETVSFLKQQKEAPNFDLIRDTLAQVVSIIEKINRLVRQAEKDPQGNEQTRAIEGALANSLDRFLVDTWWIGIIAEDPTMISDSEVMDRVERLTTYVSPLKRSAEADNLLVKRIDVEIAEKVILYYESLFPYDSVTTRWQGHSYIITGNRPHGIPFPRSPHAINLFEKMLGWQVRIAQDPATSQQQVIINPQPLILVPNID